MLKESLTRLITAYIILLAASFSLFLFFKHIDISLWYHYNQPAYYHNQLIGTAFQEPGKPAELISNFLGQFMQNNLTGSLLLTLLMIVWVVSLKIIIETFTPSNKNISLIILSVIPFVIAHSYYDFDLSVTVSYVFAALTACLIIPAINRHKFYISAILYLLLCILTYLFWGSSGILLIIGISTGLFIAHKKYAHLFLILIPLVIPMISLFVISDISIRGAYWEDFMPKVGYFVPRCMKVIPFLVLLIIVLITLFQRLVKMTLSWYNSVLIHSVVLVIFLVTAYLFSYNEIQKNRVLIDKLAYNEEWTKLLRTAKNVDLTKEREVQFQVNRALCHQGILLEKMFIYPQYFGGDGLFLDRVTASAIALPTSDLYYDLSFCNGSRHWANEALIFYGPQPRIIKRLVSCYIISNQFQLASEYLSLLESSDKHRKWALKMRKYLNGEPYMNSTEFSSSLKYKDLPDQFESLNYPRANLYILTSDAKENKNKIAVEYSVAYDLLTHDLKSIITDLKLMKEVGYRVLPRSVQEAVLIYILKEQDFKVDLQGFSIDIDVQKDFNSFNRIFASVGGDKAKSKSLHSQFKNTYWYYNVYKSPITNGREIKE